MKFTLWLEKKLAPMAAKLSGNRYIRAIQGGMIATIPMTVIGSIWLVIWALPIPGWNAKILSIFGSADVFLAPFNVTMVLLGLYIAVLVGMSLAEEYNLDRKGAMVLTLSTYLLSVIGPAIRAGKYAEYATKKAQLSFYAFGSTTIFGGILIAVFVIEIYRLCETKNIKFKFPKQIPESIARSFNVIVPVFLAILPVWILTTIFAIDVHTLLNNVFKPLKTILTENVFGVMLIPVLITILWSVGIHGANIIMPLVSPFALANLAANQAAHAKGLEVPHIVAGQFIDVFSSIGGSGATLGFLFAVMIVARKNKKLTTVSKLSLVPAIFNINEPIIFGVPIVMNPIMMIPFILAPTAAIGIGYMATKLGIIGKSIAAAPWTTPNIIMGYLTTLDWKIILVSLLIYVVITIIYMPFVKIFSDMDLKANKSK